MAWPFDVNVFTAPIVGGTHTTGLGTVPLDGTAILFQVPTKAHGGGITILEAQVSARAAGLGTFVLLTSTGGTVGIDGTITEEFGTDTLAAGTSYALTIGTAYVDATKWVLLAQTGSIIVPGGNIHISYVMGRAAV